MSFSALYEQIAQAVSEKYGVPYADVLKACKSVEKSSVSISTDAVSPIQASGAVVKEAPKEESPTDVDEVCQHVFQRGKKKNERCVRAARAGTSRCSSHSVEEDADSPVETEVKKKSKKIPNKKP